MTSVGAGGILIGGGSGVQGWTSANTASTNIAWQSTTSGATYTPADLVASLNAGVGAR